jgi:hypothetical protein
MGKFRRTTYFVVWATGFMIAIGTPVPNAAEETPEYMRLTLRGIKAVSVEVGPIKPDVENLGLRREQIQTDVELALRRSGIPVTANLSSADGHLFVVVNCTLFSSSKGDVACSLSVELIQDVRLLRDPDITSLAPTWKTGAVTVGNTGSANVREDIRDMADKFSNDYLEQNGKRDHDHSQ